MRTVKPVLIVIVLSVVTTTAQDIPAPQPYEDADAYQIYSLLLSQEESYGLGEVLLINEVTIDGALSRKCLTPEAEKQFSDAIAASYRVGAKRFRLQRRFQIKQPYKLYGPNSVVDPSAPTITISAVGFNPAKTKGHCLHRELLWWSLWSWHLAPTSESSWQMDRGTGGHMLYCFLTGDKSP